MCFIRRNVSRITNLNPRAIDMEQRARTKSIEEYCTEIFEHLSDLEERTKTSPELIISQPEITIEMRPILFDFLLDVHSSLKLSNSTFFLTINIIDRYCSSRVVIKDHFKLLGLTSLWLASKFSDSKQEVPTLNFLRATCDNYYSKNLFIEMEAHILKSLDWEIGSSSPDFFINLIILECGLVNYSTPEFINSIIYGANYLCQLIQFYTNITFKYSMSQIAIASISIIPKALTLLKNNELLHYKTTTKNNLELTNLVESILLIVSNNQPPQSLKKIYFTELGDSRAIINLHSIYQYSNEIRRLNTISKIEAKATKRVPDFKRAKHLVNITNSLVNTSNISEMSPQTPSTPISSKDSYFSSGSLGSSKCSTFISYSGTSK